jgi:hypothetical protein
MRGGAAGVVAVLTSQVTLHAIAQNADLRFERGTLHLKRLSEAHAAVR